MMIIVVMIMSQQYRLIKFQSSTSLSFGEGMRVRSNKVR